MSNYYNSGGTNPAYQGSGEKHRNDPVVVSMNNYGDTQKWSWCSTGWSFISACCCLSLFGWFGLLCSVFSYTDHKTGDYERSRYKRRWSWCCSMTGIFLTLLVVVAVIVIGFVFAAQFAAAFCPQYKGSGSNDPWTIFCNSQGQK